MIKIQNLTKKYGNNLIFDNASFSFPDKGLVCVFGPSGCGKSTLLNLLAGFDSEYEGNIVVHGTSLNQMDSAELCAYRRDNVGFVFQSYHLLSGYTALENILLATDATGKNRTESGIKARELLSKLGLSDKADQKIETLSGGQKQRVAIARALVNEPSVICSDEPTGALDRKNSTEIMELLKSLSETRLVIVITHDKKCAEYAEQIVTINDGKLLCETPASDLEEAAVLKMKDVPKMSLWKRAFKNFKVHLTRYMAVALAISIGVLCFTISLSSGNIMEQSIIDFEEKNTAYHNGYIKAEGNEREMLELLQGNKQIENSYKQYMLKDVSVTIENQTETMSEKYPMPKAVEQMSYGIMPRRGESEIAINPSLAAKFDKNIQNLIGKRAELSYSGQTYSVTISGIFNGTYDDYFVSSDIEQAMYKEASGQAYSVSYDVVDFEEIVSVSDSLKEQGFNCQDAAKEVGTFLKTFQNLKRLFFTISILIFAIGVFISVILLVKQQNTRYREVGLLAALGYTKSNIRKILFYENISLSLISALGSILLIILAIIIGKAAHFNLIFTLSQMIFSFCMTAVLILAIGLISSIRLIQTEPAKALRK